MADWKNRHSHYKHRCIHESELQVFGAVCSVKSASENGCA